MYNDAIVIFLIFLYKNILFFKSICAIIRISKIGGNDMALNLDTSSKGEDLKIVEHRNTQYKFWGAMAILGSIIVILIGSTVVKCISDSNKVNQANQELTNLNTEFEAYKQEHPVVPDNAVTEEKELPKIEKEMASAEKLGLELAALQNKFYKYGTLDNADQERLMQLVGSKALWFGGEKEDPTKAPVTWKLLTPYDWNTASYEVLFGCYTADGKYLLKVVSTTYTTYVDFKNDNNFDNTRGSFVLNNEKTYITDFGRAILNGETVGSVDNTSGSVSDNNIPDMVDQLTGSGVTTENSDTVYPNSGEFTGTDPYGTGDTTTEQPVTSEDIINGF